MQPAGVDVEARPKNQDTPMVPDAGQVLFGLRRAT
jgi:hypothetical protein